MNQPITPAMIVKELARLEFNFKRIAGLCPERYEITDFWIINSYKLLIGNIEIMFEHDDLYGTLDDLSRKYLEPLAWKRIVDQIDPAVLQYWARYA